MRKTTTAVFLVSFCLVLFTATISSAQTWTKLPGGATDVGVGANGAVWIIGVEPVAGGYSIYRWTGGAWQKVPGGAVRISVAPDGTPWIVNDTNSISRWDGSTWQRVAGSARDIAHGADGTVWSIDPNGTPHRWSGTAWVRADGVAAAVAVDPKGVPWIVTAAGEISRRNAAGTGWERIAGSAKDIAIGTDGTAYIIGSKAGAGGFHVQRRVGADWQEEPQAGVRIAAGPAGVVYVAQDKSTQQAILSRNTGTITLTGEAIPITTQPTTQTAKSDPPLVVESYLGPPRQKDLVYGSLVCPKIGTGARLELGCSFVGEPATFLGKAPSTNCPAGSFHDPQNGGECWSCPTGFIRNASPVSATDACWKAVSEDLKAATKVGTTGCPGGTFVDPRNGGECWSCPAGYMRTLAAVTAADACAKDLIFGPKSAATFHQKKGSCATGSFFDPIHGGTCWSCPADYRRTANHIETDKACAKTIPTQYASATLVSGCSELSHAGLGNAFRDPRNGGECWACPVQLKRSAAPVSTTRTGNGAACVVGGDTAGIVWKLSQYPEPGMYGFLEGLVDVAFRDPKRVDAFVRTRANNDPQKRSAIWQKMRSAPHDSPEFKALTFAALMTLATQEANPKGWTMVTGFSEYIRNRRTFVAQEATAMFSAWEDLNAYNQVQAARRASGISGMDPSVLGSTPGDYQKVAWIGASPDQRGGEFLEALTTLGAVGATTAPSAASSPEGGWDPAYLLPFYKAMDKGLDKYADWALDTVSWGKISGKAFQAAGKVAQLALIALQSAVDLSTAITTIVSQEEARKAYANLVTDAQKPVNVRDLVRSGKDEDLQQLLLYWALASSPYRAGPTAGEGQLSDAALCADPAIRPRCQSVNAVVTAAGNAVNVWPSTAAPATKAIPGFHEEARIISVDPATGTVRARMTEVARIVVIRPPDPAMLKGLKVGGMLYLDLNRKLASLDGKTTCCSFVIQGGQ